MLINIKYDNPPDTIFISKPKLLFVSRVHGENGAIPRVIHSHSDRLEVMFIYKGSGNYNIGGEFYSVKEGDVLIFNAGIIHDEQPLPSKELVIYCCGISDLRIKQLPVNSIISKNQQPVINMNNIIEQIKNYFETFLFHSTQSNPIHNEIIFYSTLSFLLTIHTSFNEREKHVNHKKITLGLRIKEFLDKYYLEQIDIESISEALNVNRYYLSHTFKAFSGYSPKQYIIRRRLGEAQSLLLHSNYSVAQIANKVGYSNVSNFHNIFEKVIGMSPVKYKNLWLDKT